MKRSKRLFALLLSITIVGLSFSCAQNKIVAPAATPGTTVTTAPMVEPTAVPTPRPTPTETEMIDKEGEDFLNQVGDYTKEIIHDRAMRPLRYSTEGGVAQIELGWVDPVGNVEGILFDYVERDGSIILAVGFNDINGESFITPIEIPLYFLDGYKPSEFNFVKYLTREVSDVYQSLKPVDVSDNRDELINYLDKLKGDYIVTSLQIEEVPPLIMDQSTGLALDFYKEYNRKLAIKGKLRSVLAENNFTQVDGYDPEKYNEFELIKLKKVSDILDPNIVDISKIPMLNGEIYFA